MLPSKFRLLGGFIPERNTGTLAGSLPLAGSFSGLSFDIAVLSPTKLIFLLIKHSVFDRELISRLPRCHRGLRSVSGTYTTACTGSSEFISFIGQANNGVACLSYVESGASRMRIDIQKAEHATHVLGRNTHVNSIQLFIRTILCNCIACM